VGQYRDGIRGASRMTRKYFGYNWESESGLSLYHKGGCAKNGSGTPV
jgi:hypothetical protein